MFFVEPKIVLHMSAKSSMLIKSRSSAIAISIDSKIVF